MAQQGFEGPGTATLKLYPVMQGQMQRQAFPQFNAQQAAQQAAYGQQQQLQQMQQQEMQQQQQMQRMQQMGQMQQMQQMQQMGQPLGFSEPQQQMPLFAQAPLTQETLLQEEAQQMPMQGFQALPQFQP